MNSNVVFAGGTIAPSVGRLFRTSNGGVSWDTLRLGADTAFVRSIGIDPADGTTIYVGTQSIGIFKSTNRGNSWTLINNGLPLPQPYYTRFVADILIEPLNPSILYAGIYLGGVYKSTNGGNSWFASDVGINGLDIRSLCFDPQNSNRIYAGAYRWGVFQSTDAGASWSRLGVGLDSVRVSAITFASMNSRRLLASSYDGGVWSYTFEPTSVEVSSKPIPPIFNLHQNYPNPFNPETSISFDLPKSSFVSLKVFNLIGQEVATLVNEVQDSGFKSVKLDASGLASGVYLYRIVAGDFVQTKKMILIR